jgi:cytochrome c biogenesis protein ResB
MKKLWNLIGSIRLTFWLLLVISLTLTAGSYSIRFSPQIFKPLNTSFLQDWYRNYGQENLPAVWWFILLLALLGMLGINTAVCVINRIYTLWKTHKNMTALVFFHKITPSLAHICFFIMLIGHFLSMTTGFHHVVPLYPGASFSLPANMKGEIVNQYCERYAEPAVISGSVKQCAVTMKLQEREIIVKQITLLDTFSWHGFTFHLGMDKKSVSPNLKLSVKRDPGVPLIVSGFSVLILLMVWYYLLMSRANKQSKRGIL